MIEQNVLQAGGERWGKLLQKAMLLRFPSTIYLNHFQITTHNYPLIRTISSGTMTLIDYRGDTVTIRW